MRVLLIIILFCVPTMLFVKPLHEKKQMERKIEKENAIQDLRKTDQEVNQN